MRVHHGLCRDRCLRPPPLIPPHKREEGTERRASLTKTRHAQRDICLPAGLVLAPMRVKSPAMTERLRQGRRRLRHPQPSWAGLARRPANISGCDRGADEILLTVVTTEAAVRLATHPFLFSCGSPPPARESRAVLGLRPGRHDRAPASGTLSRLAELDLPAVDRRIWCPGRSRRPRRRCRDRCRSARGRRRMPRCSNSSVSTARDQPGVLQVDPVGQRLAKRWGPGQRGPAGASATRIGPGCPCRRPGLDIGGLPARRLRWPPTLAVMSSTTSGSSISATRIASSVRPPLIKCTGGSACVPTGRRSRSGAPGRRPPWRSRTSPPLLVRESREGGVSRLGEIGQVREGRAGERLVESRLPSVPSAMAQGSATKESAASLASIRLAVLDADHRHRLVRHRDAGVR